MKKEILLYLSGNPSIEKVSEDFLTEIQSHKPELKIYSLYHLGQGKDLDINKKEITLCLNFEKQKDETLSIIKKEKADKVYLIAHSLGATSVISNSKEFKGKIDKYVLICPFHKLDGANHKFMQSMANPILNSAAGKLLEKSLLNNHIGPILTHHILSKSPKAPIISEAFSDPKRWNNFLTILKTYTSHFKKNDYSKNVKELSSEEVLFLFMEKDFWVPKKVREFFPKDKSEILPKLQHDFIMHEDQTMQVVSRVRDFFFQSN